MATWTAILTCKECGEELNRAEGVPDDARTQVSLAAPLVAGKCPKGHRSTFSDCNLNVELEWVKEVD